MPLEALILASSLAPLLAALSAGLSLLFLSRALLSRGRGVPLRSEFRVSAYAGGGFLRVLYPASGAVLGFAAGLGVTGKAHLAVLAALAGLYYGRRAFQGLASRRVGVLRQQYAQVLSVLSSSLKAGLMPQQALESSVCSLPEPSREVFTEVLRRYRFNPSLPRALREVAGETGWQDLETLASAVELFEETGCNLAQVLDHLAQDVHDRESDARYVRAVTAEARLTSLFLSVLPFFLMGAARLAAPDFARPLFETPGGNLVIVLCGAMVAAGNWVVSRMISRTVGG